MTRSKIKMSFGSASSERPTRLWHDAQGNLHVGPMPATHNMHYATINHRGDLNFVRSMAVHPAESALTPMENPEGKWWLVVQAECGHRAVALSPEDWQAVQSALELAEAETDIVNRFWRIARQLEQQLGMMP